jgi:hypothetical protein
LNLKYSISYVAAVLHIVNYSTENDKARQHAAVKQHNQLDITTEGIYSNKLVSRGRPACMSGNGRREVAFID